MIPPDAEARERARRDLEHNLVVDAGAGTGKTTVLIDRILALVTSGRCVLDKIAAITFTEKAAGELKLRLRNVLEERLAATGDGDSGETADRMRKALEDLDRAHVSTIHAFCATILRERPAEAGVDPGFVVLDQLAAFVLRHQVWQRWIAAELGEQNPLVARALAADVSIQTLQEAAIYLLENRDLLSLLPGPCDARVGAFAEQLGRRLHDLRALQASCKDDTDAGCIQIQNLERAFAELSALDDEERATFLAALQVRITAGNRNNWRPPERLATVKEIFRELSHDLTELTGALRHNLCLELIDWLGGYLRVYDVAKQQRGALDFTDLLVKARDLLRDNFSVRRQFQHRFRVLLVDEFQDTDPLQTEIVFFLAERLPRARRWHEVELTAGKLFLVGDPKQSIYRFRRADIELYDEAKRVLMRPGEAHAAAIDLRTNFRSRRPLIAWLNRRFAGLIQHPDGESYQPDYVPLVPAPDLPDDDGVGVRLLPLPSPPQNEGKDPAGWLRLEARVVTEFIVDLVRTQGALVRDAAGSARTIGYGDVAILFRDNEAMHPYEDELRDADVPYRVAGGRRFYAREEVAALLSLLRAVANPKDEVNLVAALRGSFFGFSDEQLYLFKTSGGSIDYQRSIPERADGAAEIAAAFTCLRQLHRRSLEIGPARLLAEIFREIRHALPMHYLKSQGDQRVANLLKLVDIARALESDGVHSVRGLERFFGDLERLQAEEGESPVAEDTDDVVRLMTIHKAKGLEFPVVVIANGRRDLEGRAGLGVADRLAGEWAVRIGAVRTGNWERLKDWEKPRAEAEEIRLLYVAATRARDHLVLPLLPAEARGTFLGRLVDPPSEWASVADTSGYDLPARPMRAFRIAEVAEAKPDAAAVAEARECERRRQAVIAAASPGSRYVRPSSIAHDGDTAGQRSFAFGRPEGAQVGTLVHAVLQRLDVTRPETIDALAAGLAGDLEPAGLADACRLVRRALALPVLERAVRAGTLRREVPFRWRVGKDLVEGVIDLVFEEGGKLVVVDYKTDEVGPGRALAERVAIHRAQAVIYAAALEEITGGVVKEVVLAFLRPGVEHLLRGRWRDEARRLLPSTDLAGCGAEELLRDSGP